MTDSLVLSRASLEIFHHFMEDSDSIEAVLRIFVDQLRGARDHHIRQRLIFGIPLLVEGSEGVRWMEGGKEEGR